MKLGIPFVFPFIFDLHMEKTIELEGRENYKFEHYCNAILKVQFHMKLSVSFIFSFYLLLKYEENHMFAHYCNAILKVNLDIDNIVL
jgi:hypothetical protein